MNCLIIAGDIGVTAAGIVFETIIRELAKDIKVSLIAPEYRKGINLPVHILPSFPQYHMHYRIERILMTLLGYPFPDACWLVKQKALIKTDIAKQQDIIVSFVSSQNYKGMLLGYYISQKFNKKWVVYFVDAIPAPIGWNKNNRLYKNVRRFVAKYILSCDAFFSANGQMLKYQLDQVPSFKKLSGVMFTPIRDSICISHYSNTHTNPVFLYTGGIYGPRRIEALLEGFRLFLKDYPLARLIFVGINRSQVLRKYQDLIDSEKLQVFAYTQDLIVYYEKASVLIDINAYFDNDVFLSSKIVNYLPIQKPIISISGLNSPARNIFTRDPSIIHCRYDVQDIYWAMCKVVKVENWNWSIRKEYIKQFSVENTIAEFKGVISNFSSSTV